MDISIQLDGPLMIKNPQRYTKMSLKNARKGSEEPILALLQLETPQCTDSIPFTRKQSRADPQGSPNYDITQFGEKTLADQYQADANETANFLQKLDSHYTYPLNDSSRITSGPAKLGLTFGANQQSRVEESKMCASRDLGDESPVIPNYRFGASSFMDALKASLMDQ